jgi:hypothetical protein
VLTGHHSDRFPVADIRAATPVSNNNKNILNRKQTDGVDVAPNSISAAQKAPLPFSSGSSGTDRLSPSYRYDLPREEVSPTKMTQVGPIRRLSDPRLEQHLLETLDPQAVQGSNYGSNYGTRIKKY